MTYMKSVPMYSIPKQKREIFHTEPTPGPQDYNTNWKLLSQKKRSKRAIIAKSGLTKSLPRLQMVQNPHNNHNKDKKHPRWINHGDNPENLRSRKRSTDFDTKNVTSNLGANFHSYSLKNSTLKTNGAKIARSQYDRDKKLTNKQTPGPGAYEFNFSSFTKKGIIFKKSGTYDNLRNKRRTLGDTKPLPGPADYNYNFSSLDKKGIWKFKPPSPQNQDFSSPGPADYYTERSSLQKGVSIFRAKREGIRDVTPGPGDYKIHKNEKKGISFKKSNFEKKIENFPGPAKYETILSSLDRKGMGKISSQKRAMFEAKDVPGPADYNILVKNFKRGISFKKFKGIFNKNTNPGPGAYNYKCSFPDVANYLVKTNEPKINYH